ncbi:MAG: hypothetical protein P1R58_04615 [bacterium]|nr:hypothetical protein [bacterium]
MNVKRMPIQISLLFVLLLGNVCAQEITKESNNLYSTGELSASVTIDNSSNHLQIESVPQLQGSIRIVAENIQTIEAIYRKKARTSSRSRAIDYIDLIRVSVNSTPQGVRILMHAPNPVRWDPDNEAGLVEMEISVPHDCQVEIEAAYFDVDATGPFSEMSIPASLGRIQVSDVNGKTMIGTTNQRLTVERLSGEIDISTSNAKLEAFDIKSLGKPATIRNQVGDININGVIGSVNVKNSFGRIEIERFVPMGGKNFVRGQSAPILMYIDSIRAAEVIVRNQNEDIEIMVPQNISVELSLAVGDDGRIEASNLEFIADIVQQNRLILRSAEGAARIAGSIRGEGNIYITGVD